MQSTIDHGIYLVGHVYVKNWIRVLASFQKLEGWQTIQLFLPNNQWCGNIGRDGHRVAMVGCPRDDHPIG